MKKGFKTFITLAMACAVAAASFAADAKVTSVTGKVQAQKKGSSEWVDVKKNDVLDTGTLISTGFNSNATLNLGNSICTIAPLTRMSIEQLTEKKLSDDKKVTKTTVYIDTGKAAFKVNSTNKSLNDFRVHSPASTASVRGTEFVVYANGETGVSHGLVAVSSGVERKAMGGASKDYFISDGKPITGFSSSSKVSNPNEGGKADAIPVFGGQRVTIETGFSTKPQTTPFAQRHADSLSLPGDSATLADKTVVTGAEATLADAEPGSAGKELDLGEMVDVTISLGGSD